MVIQNNNKQLAINMFFSIIAFLLNLFINFFITPFITSQFGSEAYGFVKLANDFANYASLISVALNSMASRFIMIEREQGNHNQANKYYTSVMYANVVLSMLMLIPSILCVFFIDQILNVPTVLLVEVKMTFALTFLNFIVNLLFSIYSNCYYLSNRLDLNSIRTAESNIIRVIVTLLLLFVLTPHISYIALGTLIASLYLCIRHYFHAKRLIPDLVIHRQFFDWKSLKEILSSGLWNSLTKLSQIFSSGLDLLMTNLLVGSVMMGFLSVAKTVPNLIATFNATIANVFSPNLMRLYAINDLDNLKATAKSAMKFMCLFVAIPNAILVTMGQEFFQLWVPEQPATLINVLSVMTVINSCVTGPTQPLYQIFTITNKVKESSIVMIIYGFSTMLITYTLLNTTNLGVYAVAGVSLVGSILVALGYHIPFAAKYIGLPKYTFFPEIGKSIISFVVLCLVGFAVNLLFDLSSSWVMWFIGAILTAIIGFIINIFLILSIQERNALLNKFLNKIKRS